jgi:hypothetical protein
MMTQEIVARPTGAADAGGSPAREAWRWALALLGALALAGALRALQACLPQTQVTAWPVAVGLALAGLLAWVGGGAALALALGLPARAGRAAALAGSAAWCAALAWSRVARIHLPPPHDLPQRPLQILVAGALLSGSAVALAALLRQVLKAGALARLSPRSVALRLGGLAWVAYLACSLWTWRWLMVGDAPHYMLITASIAQHGTVDLLQDYRAGESRRYYTLEHPLEQSALLTPNGRMVSLHQPLLPLLAAPGYRLGGFAGALWTQTLLGALATALFYLLLRHRGRSAREALIGWAVFAFGAAWAIYSQSMLTEVLAGLLGLAWLCAWEGILPAAWAFLIPALMPWVGTRMSLAAAGACLAWLWRWRRQPLKGALPGVLASLAILGNSAFNRWAWGDPSLNAFLDPHVRYFDVTQAYRGLMGMLLDQEWGLLPWAPVLLLAAAGAATWVRRRDGVLLPILAWCLPYLGLMACFLYWDSGQAPNRYLIPLVPALALAAVDGLFALQALAWPWALAAVSWALSLVMMTVPWFCYSKGHGECWPLRLLGSALGLRLTFYFPSFIINTPQSYLWSLGLVLVVARLAWHPALPRRTPG